MISHVADTHAVLWYFYDDPRLSEQARMLMDDAATSGSGIGVSAITFSETVYLIEKGKISQTEAFDDLTLAIADPDIPFFEVPVDSMIVSVMREISRESVRDPWDRMIAATAIALDVSLITKDEKLHNLTKSGFSKLTTIW